MQTYAGLWRIMICVLTQGLEASRRDYRMLADTAVHAPPRARNWLALAALAPALFLIFPRLAPFLALALGGAILAAASMVDVRRQLSRLPAPILAMLAFAAWALVSLIWSVDRSGAAAKIGLLVLLTATVWSTAISGPRLSDDLIGQIQRTLLLAFVIGLAYLAIEEVTGHAIKRLAFSLLTWARPSTKHIIIEADSGEVMKVHGEVSNRSMAALSLALWPMLLLAGRVLEHGRRWWGTAAILAAAAGTIAVSQHETSVLALVAALAVLALMQRWPRAGLAAVAAGWMLATLAVVPITDWAFRTAQWHQAAWLPQTARQRIILWGYTARQVPLRPLTGVGADSTKPLDASRGSRVETPAGFEYQWRSGPHAHNIFLQNWYELGLPGAVLLCAFGLAVLHAISRLLPYSQACITAAFVTAAITAAFTWGLWQTWFMGAFALSAILGLLALEVDRRAAAGNGSSAQPTTLRFAAARSRLAHRPDTRRPRG